jgi:hypothetical protein
MFRIFFMHGVACQLGTLLIREGLILIEHDVNAMVRRSQRRTASASDSTTAGSQEAIQSQSPSSLVNCSNDV